MKLVRTHFAWLLSWLLLAVAPLVTRGESKDDGCVKVGFDLLASYDYVVPAADKPAEPKGGAQIPERVKALNNQQVRVTGFMLPVKMEKGLVTEFLLVRDAMMCCYGVMPKLNEWIVVKMRGSGVPPLMDVPIAFEGRLKVGELYDNGYLTGLYFLEGERQVEGKAQ